MKQNPSGKHKVSPVRLDFEDEEADSDPELKKEPTFSDVDTDQEIPDLDKKEKNS